MLSRKKYCNATFARRICPELCREIRYLNLAIVNDAAMAVEVEPTLESKIRKAQQEDKLREIRRLIKENKTSDFTEDDKGTLWLGNGYVSPVLSLFRS
jgi:hypothetical protein